MDVSIAYVSSVDFNRNKSHKQTKDERRREIVIDLSTKDIQRWLKESGRKKKVIFPGSIMKITHKPERPKMANRPGPVRFHTWFFEP